MTMNTNITILATTLLLAPMLACDTTEDHELLTATDFRGDPSEFWQEVLCVNGTTCWALHPNTSDAWVRVQTWAEIEYFVELGRLKHDFTGGYGPFSCAPGKFPDSVPVQQCYRRVGTFHNVCYGGGATLAAEIMPTCATPAGYTAENYLAVGCTWDLGEHTDAVELSGHVTQIEAGLLVEGNGAMLIAPGCHVVPEP
jgi:hypothetical protein